METSLAGFTRPLSRKGVGFTDSTPAFFKQILKEANAPAKRETYDEMLEKSSYWAVKPKTAKGGKKKRKSRWEEEEDLAGENTWVDISTQDLVTSINNMAKMKYTSLIEDVESSVSTMAEDLTCISLMERSQ